MRSLLPAVLLFASFPAATACKGIPSAPANSQRQELEVVIAVAPAFTQALLNSDAGLGRAIEAAMLAEADVGLRFYPVATGAYASGHSRPPYRMRIELQTLQIDVSGAEKHDVKRVKAGVAVSIEKRRDNAPALLVANATDQADHKPESKSSGSAVEASYAVAGIEAPVPSVPQAEIVAAARAAFRAAVKEMVRAIDRELEPRK